jgi:hypothetical protein
LETVEGPENLWLHEVKDRPELTQVILEGRTRQDHSVPLDFKPLHVSPELSVSIFGLMAFIYNYYIVADVRKILRFSGDHAVAGDEYAAFTTQLLHLLVASVFFVAFVIELCDGDALAPFAEFLLPISLHGGRHDHKHFHDLFGIKQAFEIGCYLDSLSQAHIITQDAALFLPPQLVQPLHTELLVIEKRFKNFGRD